MPTNERYKQLMEQVGMPQSRSLLLALQQVANEVAQEYEQKISALRAEVAEMTARLRDAGDEIARLRKGTIEAQLKHADKRMKQRKGRPLKKHGLETLAAAPKPEGK